MSLLLANFKQEGGFVSEIEWLDIFGNNLADILKDEYMTRKELSEVLNMTEATISRYINKRQMPTMKVIINMAYELSITVDDLIDFGDNIY